MNPLSLSVAVALLVVSGVTALSMVLTDRLERRRARGRITLVSERADDPLTILAKRRAERAKQLGMDPYTWD